MDDIHLLRFSAFECPGYEVAWGDVDDPVGGEDYLTEREFQRFKRRHLAPTEHLFSHVWGYTDFYKPACLSPFVGGRAPCILDQFPLVRAGCASPLMLPFTEHRAHTCILIGSSIDSLSAPSSLFCKGHPLPLLDEVLALYSFQNHYKLQSLPGKLALYWILQTFVPIVITLAIPYGTVMLFHLDHWLFITP